MIEYEVLNALANYYSNDYDVDNKPGPLAHIVWINVGKDMVVLEAPPDKDWMLIFHLERTYHIEFSDPNLMPIIDKILEYERRNP